MSKRQELSRPVGRPPSVDGGKYVLNVRETGYREFIDFMKEFGASITQNDALLYLLRR